MKSPEYYGRPRYEMAGEVPGQARRLLDVGCGAGAFAAVLRQQRGEGLRIEGIELDPGAAERAGEVLDAVHVGDAVTRLEQLAGSDFDCVIMNDLIEHVENPERLLAAARDVLRPDGHLVTSMPNVRYFFNVVDLAVHGRWDYTDEGILDRTHLRFFTKSSMVKLLEGAGFGIESLRGINPTGSLKFKLANLLTLGRWADMRYLQFAIVARRGN